MSNTITQRTLFGGARDRRIVRLITIVSDGSEESDLVIFDNSAFIDNVLKGKLVSLIAAGSSCQCLLEWDQTTDSPIIAVDPATSQTLCFKEFGGISNPGGTGATGDIVLTTTNLDAGDVVTLIIEVIQN